MGRPATPKSRREVSGGIDAIYRHGILSFLFAQLAEIELRGGREGLRLDSDGSFYDGSSGSNARSRDLIAAPSDVW